MVAASPTPTTPQMPVNNTAETLKAKVDPANATSNNQPPTTNNLPSKPKRKFSLKLILGTVVLLLLVTGAAAAYYLSQQSQDIRQQAASNCSTTCPDGTYFSDPNPYTFATCGDWANEACAGHQTSGGGNSGGGGGDSGGGTTTAATDETQYYPDNCCRGTDCHNYGGDWVAGWTACQNGQCTCSANSGSTTTTTTDAGSVTNCQYWCAGCEGFCGDAGVAQGINCNDQARARCGDVPCYENNTCSSDCFSHKIDDTYACNGTTLSTCNSDGTYVTVQTDSTRCNGTGSGINQSGTDITTTTDTGTGGTDTTTLSCPVGTTLSGSLCLCNNGVNKGVNPGSTNAEATATCGTAATADTDANTSTNNCSEILMNPPCETVTGCWWNNGVCQNINLGGCPAGSSVASSTQCQCTMVNGMTQRFAIGDSLPITCSSNESCFSYGTCVTDSSQCCSGIGSYDPSYCPNAYQFKCESGVLCYKITDDDPGDNRTCTSTIVSGTCASNNLFGSISECNASINGGIGDCSSSQTPYSGGGDVTQAVLSCATNCPGSCQPDSNGVARCCDNTYSDHEYNCSNGVDDDGDGTTDCADTDCIGTMACRTDFSDVPTDYRVATTTDIGSCDAWCATWDCPNGDTSGDGQCTLDDAGATFITNIGTDCPEPASGCGQRDYFSALPEGINWEAYCDYDYLSFENCSGGSFTPPTYQCNSSCTADSQCQDVNLGGNPSFFCSNGQCRLQDYPESETCQPAVGPQCLNIVLNNITNPSATAPSVGDQVNFTCGQAAAVDHYVFRIFVPGVSTPLSLSASASGSNISENYTITQSGQHYAQCQICTSADPASCLPWEPVGTN